MNRGGPALGMHAARRARVEEEDERRRSSPMSEEYERLFNILKERNDVFYSGKMASKIRGL